MDLVKQLLQKERLVNVSSQTIWQLIGKVITSLSTLWVLSLVSRNFGESGTGIFTLALTYLTFFYLAADLGANAHILPQMLKGDYSSIWQRLFGMRLLSSFVLVILAAIIVVGWPITNPIFKQSVLMGLLAVFGSSIFVTSGIVFQSKFRFDLSIISQTVGSFTTLLLIFLIASNHLPLPNLLVGHMFGWIITGVLSLILVSKYVNLEPIFDLKFIFRNLEEMWPITLTLILNIVYFRVDSFLLSYFRDFSDVGIYNLSYQIFQAALVIPTFIMNSVYPILVGDFQADYGRFIKNLRRVLFFMFSIASIGTLLTYIFSPLVINILVGGIGFAGSIPALQVLSISFPAFFTSSVFMWLLIIYKKYKQMMWIYLIGLIFNTILNLTLIPRYSFMAASLNTVLSEYLILLMQIFILRNILFKDFLKAQQI